MKNILISSLIVMTPLLSHDNFNHVSTNVDTFELGSSYVKLDHQSHFYTLDDETVILQLIHSPHFNYIQNEVGLGYRTSFRRFGIGANFYYMGMNKPRTFLHQISPGVEILYKNWQMSYNFYMPMSPRKAVKKGYIEHSRVSELGLMYKPTKEVAIEVLPHFDHSKRQWGLNSKISYIFSDTYEISVSPSFKNEGNGCVISFGVHFGGSKPKKSNSMLRSNDFIYSVERKKSPTIFVEQPKAEEKPAPAPIKKETPPARPPYLMPEEPKEEKLVDPKEKPKGTIWDYLPWGTYKEAAEDCVVAGFSAAAIGVGTVVAFPKLIKPAPSKPGEWVQMDNSVSPELPEDA